MEKLEEITAINKIIFWLILRDLRFFTRNTYRYFWNPLSGSEVDTYRLLCGFNRVRIRAFEAIESQNTKKMFLLQFSKKNLKFLSTISPCFFTSHLDCCKKNFFHPSTLVTNYPSKYSYTKCLSQRDTRLKPQNLRSSIEFLIYVSVTYCIVCVYTCRYVILSNVKYREILSNLPK